MNEPGPRRTTTGLPGFCAFLYSGNFLPTEPHLSHPFLQQIADELKHLHVVNLRFFVEHRLIVLAADLQNVWLNALRFGLFDERNQLVFRRFWPFCGLFDIFDHFLFFLAAVSFGDKRLQNQVRGAGLHRRPELFRKALEGALDLGLSFGLVIFPERDQMRLFAGILLRTVENCGECGSDTVMQG